MKNQVTEVFMFKPIMILTTLLFLLVAPAPDSQDIAEITANFLVLDNQPGLLASDDTVRPIQEEILK